MSMFKSFDVITEIFETDQYAIEMSRNGCSDKERWEWAVIRYENVSGYTVPDAVSDIGWKAYVSLSLVAEEF